jgi:adenylate cyclase class 2
MMDVFEIEIKAYCDDLVTVACKLKAMGAEYIGRAAENDTYLSHPARDFKNTDEALRIRRSEGKIILTYKGPKIGDVSKTRLEREVEAADYDSLLAIFNHLGFREGGSVAKAREKYVLNDIEICLDTVAGLGTFVEFEKKGSAREAAERELFNLAGELDLQRFERRSYLELIASSI